MKAITTRWLTSKGACEDQVVLFGRLFAESADLTRANAILAATNGLDLDWLAGKLLPAPARQEYERVTATARQEYERVRAPARQEYERVKGNALADALGLPALDDVSCEVSPVPLANVLDALPVVQTLQGAAVSTDPDWSTIFGDLPWSDDLLDLREGEAFIEDAAGRSALVVRGIHNAALPLSRDQYVAIGVLVTRAPEMLAALAGAGHPLAAEIKRRITDAVRRANTPEEQP